jgi:hypothetical protein
MDNIISIKSDGINVYAELRVKANLIGKVILSIMVSFLIIFFIFIFSNLNAEEVGPSILGIFLIAIFSVGIPAKFLFWNLFGKEYLIVNTKSISYHYDYGIFRTKLKTIKYHRLGTGFEKHKTHDNITKGYLVFYNYNADNDIPEIIHQTTVLVEDDKVRLLDYEIDKVFENEFNNHNGFIPFSQN